MCLAIALAFIQAPFSHVHEHEKNAAHASTPFHAHFSHLDSPGTGPQVRPFEPDDDAVDQPWFAATVDHLSLKMAFPERIFVLAVATEAGAVVPTPIEGGHDPPRITRSSPRSPPQA